MTAQQTPTPVAPTIRQEALADLDLPVEVPPLPFSALRPGMTVYVADRMRAGEVTHWRGPLAVTAVRRLHGGSLVLEHTRLGLPDFAVLVGCYLAAGFLLAHAGHAAAPASVPAQRRGGSRRPCPRDDERRRRRAVVRGATPLRASPRARA